MPRVKLKFTYTYFLQFQTELQKVIDQDKSNLIYSKDFIESWDKKTSSLRKSCLRETDKMYGKPSTILTTRLSRSVSAKFDNFTDWLTQEKPELIEAWEKYLAS